MTLHEQLACFDELCKMASTNLAASGPISLRIRDRNSAVRRPIYPDKETLKPAADRLQAEQRVSERTGSGQ